MVIIPKNNALVVKGQKDVTGIGDLTFTESANKIYQAEVIAVPDAEYKVGDIIWYFARAAKAEIEDKQIIYKSDVLAIINEEN